MSVCKRVFSVGFGPGLDSMSPARRSHGWLPQKTGWPGLRGGGIDGYNLHSPPVAHQPRAGTTHFSSYYYIFSNIIYVHISCYMQD